MSWLFVALAAYLGFALVAVIDKYLLAGPIKSPAFYSAMAGFLSVLSFALLPFAPYVPDLNGLLIDILTGAVFILSLWVYYKALKLGQASRVVPLASALVPFFTFILAHQFSLENLSAGQTLGFGLLIIGGFLVSFNTREIRERKIEYQIFFLTLLASFLFASHFVLVKYVYSTQPFIGGLVWTSIGKIAAGLLIVAYLYKSQAEIFKGVKLHKPRSWITYLGARAIGGASGLGQNYAISLASVSLITALQGFQYAFLFVLVFWVGKKIKAVRENFDPPILKRKIFAALLLSFGLIFISLSSQPVKKIELGITFSKPFAIYGLQSNWRKMYNEIISELEIKWLRLPVYWTEAQPKPNEWFMDDVEYQVNLASDKDINIILVVGQKLPRWPECHIPGWVNDLNYDDRQQALLNYIREVVMFYEENPKIVAWQIENEPLFPFGNCPEPSKQLLQKEIDLVHSLSRKPIIVTDSGEFSTWLPEARMADILGTTMYRTVYNPYSGLIRYPLPSQFFTLKEMFAKFASGRLSLPIYNMELQAEPWGPRPLDELPLDSQLDLMNAKILRDNVEYARKAGFSPTLLWGAEWWWWLKEFHNDPSLWDSAQEIIADYNN